MSNGNSIHRARREGPWRPVIEDLEGSQPQGLLDFPPGTNVSLKTDLSFWQLVRIQLSNLFFSIVTLGVYRFWGRTRLRRQIWHGIEVAGVRLLYHGTGLELFVSNLLLVLILAIPFTALSLAQNIFAIGSMAWAIASGASLIGLYFLYFAGRYWRFRYWAERTTWSGIRARLKGSAWVYALLALWQGVLVVVTLGIWFPNMQTRLASYLVNHMTLGTFKPQWIESRAGLSSAWILVWGIGLLTGVAWLGFAFVQAAASANGQSGSLAGLMFFLPAFAGTLALPFALLGYQVAFVRTVVASFALGEMYLFSQITFLRAAWIWARLVGVFAISLLVVSALALLFLGVLDPWFANLARSSYASLTLIAGEQSNLVPTIPWIKTVLFWSTIAWAAGVIAGAFTPMLSMTLWSHMHARTMAIEGSLDFSKLTQVEPGGFRPLGEGVALALDMGGL